MIAQRTDTLPDWLPDAVSTYLAHVVGGESIRSLARRSGRHASTVLRQVRRCETRREDPLVDKALQRLSRSAIALGDYAMTTECARIVAETECNRIPNEREIEEEALRILRRLAEPGACLAVAEGMAKAVVVREGVDGRTVRTGVLETAVAEAMALREWIAARGDGRVARYQITATGRTALKDLITGAERQKAECRDADESAKAGRARYGVAESPLHTLARRRDRDGVPFLPESLVRVGERLREDFELAQMEGPRIDANWAERLCAGGTPKGDVSAAGPAGARARLEVALCDLGPGLGDVVLRVCCLLEGIEAVEKRMGWAARSGKVVLRIGLQRLERHFELAHGRFGPMIG